MDDDTEDATLTRIKNIRGTPFALNSEYRAWSDDGLEAEGPDAPSMAISLTRGSDAATERDATVQIALKNRSKHTERLYFRRELAELTVLKPKGLVTCSPETDDRAPTPQSFMTFAPGQVVTLAARLVEMCPRGTFSRPGMYLVNVDFTAVYDGSEFGLRAYTGTLQGKRAATVRVRKGEQPFLVIKPRPPGSPPVRPAGGTVPPPPAPPPPPAQ